MTYLNAKKYILSSPEKTKKSALSSLLESLGNPQKRLKYLRLAGSNGKTVCAEILRSITTHAGHTVGCLRMPIAEEPRNSICIGTSTLSMDDFAEYAAIVRELSTEQNVTLTRSEIMLIIAILAFRHNGCELCIIESDRFDTLSVRVLPAPFATVICGTVFADDKQEMAAIKSYITRGVEEVVTSPQSNEAFKIISDACYAVGCRLTVPSKRAITLEKLNFRGACFSYKGISYSLSLCGRFQVANAVLALEVADMLVRRGYTITVTAVRDALDSLKIPAKFEVISISPVIIVDSTYIHDAIQTVCDSFADFKELTGNRVRLCLPCGEIIDTYRQALESRGYVIENTYTLCNDGTNADDVITYKNSRSLASALLSGLGKDTVLMISGEHAFVDDVRYRLLAKMGF